MHALCFAALLSAVLVAACASAGPSRPARPGGTASQPGQANSPPAEERVITVSIATEPNFIAAQSPLDPRGATDHYQRMFNAQLDLHDDQGRGQPYLAEALPVLNTDSWILFPDGRMETRYRLRPNLVWHDGARLTADDFVFASQIATPPNGFRTSVTPYTQMADVVAPDDRSLVIRWKGTYAEAGVLLGANRFGMVPLPRHILQEVSRQGVEAIQNHPHWTTEFVGAGPFKLARWERGAFLEAVAFDQHALGRPKIDRIQLQFITDQNTAFANLLAGSTDVALLSISFPQMVQLKQQWAATKQGTVGYTVAAFGAAYFQHKPEYARPRAGLDVAVHKALAYGLDKQTLAETIGAGELRVMDTIFDTTADYYPAIDRAITKYSYDPRASERTMTEAGYAKGPDGVWASPTEGHLTFSISAPTTRLEPPVMAANWRQVGFDIEERPLNLRAELGNDAMAPFIYNNSYTAAEVAQFARYKGSEVATAENRWNGENISGWSNPVFDRLVDVFTVTLDPNERIQQRAQMAKIMSDELPSLQLLVTPNPHAVVSRVKNVSPTTRPGTMGRITWNIHTWELE